MFGQKRRTELEQRIVALEQAVFEADFLRGQVSQIEGVRESLDRVASAQHALFNHLGLSLMPVAQDYDSAWKIIPKDKDKGTA